MYKISLSKMLDVKDRAKSLKLLSFRIKNYHCTLSNPFIFFWLWKPKRFIRSINHKRHILLTNLFKFSYF